MRLGAQCAAVLLALLTFGSSSPSAIAQEQAEQGLQADAREAAKEAAHEEVEGHGPNPLAVDPDLAIWTAVVFLILFAILSVFAWPQIAAAVDERERRIVDNIKAAEGKHEEAKRLLAEHEAKLAATAGEIREMLEEARRDADHTRKKIEATGHQAAQDELTRALREIERAKDGAIQELAVASANVAIDLAGKVIQTQLTAEKNNELIRDALSKLTPMSSQELLRFNKSSWNG
jgi:F-type H+-transporting ATPase subunit b